MADNIPVNTGDDVSIATDEVGSHHYQRIKLTDGTDGSISVIRGDSTWGLDVDITRLPFTPLTVTGNIAHSEITTTASSNLIAAPGSGQYIKIYHMAGANHGSDDVTFKLRNGTSGQTFRKVTLVNDGGLWEVNLARPILLGANTALRYEYVSGSTVDISLTIGYETVTG